MIHRHPSRPQEVVRHERRHGKALLRRRSPLRQGLMGREGSRDKEQLVQTQCVHWRTVPPPYAPGEGD